MLFTAALMDMLIRLIYDYNCSSGSGSGIAEFGGEYFDLVWYFVKER